MAKHNTANPSLFRQLSEPFNDLEEADAAVKAFLDDLGHLREKHKIPNVLTVIAASALADDGVESEFLMPHFYGDSLRMESLAAYAYGVAAKARQEAIGASLKGTLKQRDLAFNERT